MNSKWGNPNTVGKIYLCTASTPHSPFLRGQYYLCAKHTGDCHYTWITLHETRGNEWSRYFTGTKKFSGYGIPEEWAISSEVKTLENISDFVLGMLDGGGTITLARPEERSVYDEISEELDQMGLGYVPPKVLEHLMTKAGVTVGD